MRKFLILAFLLFTTPLFADEFTTNYNLQIPSIGGRDWQPTISKDIVSMDTILYAVSQDSAKMTYVSNDVADLKTKTTIISNDIAYYPIRIISHDIGIISTDVQRHKLSIDIISDDISFVRYYKLPRAAPTGNAVISYDGSTLDWKPIYDQTIVSYPLSVANGGTGSAVGYTVVSNDVGDLKFKTSIISSDAINSFIKGWANVKGDGTAINDSFNVSGITDGGAGDLTVTWDKDFATTSYACVVSIREAGDNPVEVQIWAQATGSVQVKVTSSSGPFADPDDYSVIAIGDQ
jgi:hypothetical protein